MHLVPRTLSLALLVLALPVEAQGRLAFEASTLDLGRIAEGGGPVATTFTFTNAGDAPLRLTSVEVACGCTTPSWTDTAVAPGASGTVEVAYDPAGRPGDFEKAVFVRAEGAEPAAVTLRVTGVVRPALAERGVRMGALAFDKTTADAGAAPAGEPIQTSFQFANVGERPVRIERVEAPEGVEVVFPPRPIFPDRLGGLFVTIPLGDLHGLAQSDPGVRLTPDHGFEMDLTVHTDDPAGPAKTVRVVGRLDPLTVEHHGTIH